MRGHQDNVQSGSASNGESGEPPPELLAIYPPDLVVIMNPVYVDEIRADLEQMDLAPELVTV